MRKRYRAVIFFPGPASRWKTARNFKTGNVVNGIEPDPSEVILEKEFITRVFADAWARVYLKRLKNVCGGVYVKPTLDQ